LDCRYINSRNF